MHLSELVERAEGGLVPIEPLKSDPVVQTVVTTDLLDPRRYLSGGELVLTGLAWWRPEEPDRARQFVAALVSAGVAALAAGEAQLGGVPVELVDECRRAELPLLRVPVEASFADITERALRQLAGGEGLVELLTRHRSLVAAVAAREQGGTGLDGLLAMVRKDLGTPCWVLTPAGRVVAGPASELDEGVRRAIVRRHLGAPASRGNGDGPVLRVDGHLYRLFAAPPGPPPAAAWCLAVRGDLDHAVADLLASLVALERDLFLRRPDREAALVAALDGTDADGVVSALHHCGYDPSAPAAVVAGHGPYARAVLTDVLATEQARWAVGEAGAGWVLGVVAVADGPRLADRLAAALSALAPGLGPEPLRVGVSDAVTGGPGLLGAAAEARAVAGVSAMPHIVTGPDRLASHELLLAAVPPELRRAYRGRVLGPLIDHDRAHRTDLVQTLATYLDCSGSWSRCAERMHLHVNTVRYRIERIEALTGRDLRRLEDQVDLLVALRLPA